MDLILNAKNLTGNEPKLKLAFQAMDSTVKTEVYTSVDSVLTRLFQTSFDEATVILNAKHRDELSELLPILPLFEKVRVVMLLPNQKPETIKMGYKKESRLSSLIDRGISEVKSIFGNMSPPKLKRVLR